MPLEPDGNPYDITDPLYNQYRANNGDMEGSKPISSWAEKLFPNGIVNSDIADVGRLGVGIYGATQNLPVYSKPAAWTSYVDRMRQMSNQGLTPEETSFATSGANNAYAGDISNINNASAGNGAVALGNYGRAVNSLYRDKAALSAHDAAMRRSNLLAYGNVLGQDNVMGRQIFEDKLAQEQHNKQSGAALMSDALHSMSQRGTYNRQYGDGSPYDKWVKSLTAETDARKDATKKSTDAYIKYITSQGETPIVDTRDPNSLPYIPTDR